MRAYIPDFDMQRASSLEDALQRLDGSIQPFAGGTDIMVVMAAGKLPAGRYLDLSAIRELQGIEVSDNFVKIGSLTTYRQIVDHPTLAAEFPNLVEAAKETGAWAIQNRGTIGGNIANASPAADTPPALLVYGAEIELASKIGTRRLPYAGFHTGYKTTLRQSDELITAVLLPRRSRQFHYYRKVGTRKAQAISKVLITACLDQQGLHLAYGALAPTAVLCPQTAALVQSAKSWGSEQAAQAQSTLAAEIAPINDIRSTKEYRFQVAANLLEELWTKLQSRS